MFEQVMRRGMATLATVFTAVLLGWAGSANAYEVTPYPGYLEPVPVATTGSGDVFVGGRLQNLEPPPDPPDGNFYLGTGAVSSDPGCEAFDRKAIALGLERPEAIESDAGGTVWVASDSELRSVDPSTCEGSDSPIDLDRTARTPNGLAVSPAGDFAYLAGADCGGSSSTCQQPNTVLVVDLIEGEVSDVVDFPGSDPRGVAVSPDGSEVYVAGAADGKIWSFDAVDTPFTATTLAEGLNGPDAVVPSRDGSVIYVTETSGFLAVVDAETGEVSRVALGPDENTSVDLAESPDGSLLYVLNSRTDGSSISVVSAESPRSRVAGIQLPRFVENGAENGVRALAISPTGDRLWVTADVARTLMEVDLRPTNDEQPEISGTAQVGQTLTSSEGSWSGYPEPTYSYQWQRCDAGGNDCASIPGADDPTYILTGQDEGSRIRVRVTASNSVGSAVAESDPTATVEPEPPSPPANTALPTITGAARVGQEITAGNGTWTGSPAPTFAYQWQRCDAGGNDCASIPGADDPTYILTGQDEGSRIRVRVTASNMAGFAEASSDPTAAVGPRPTARLSRPTIKGPARAKLRKPVTYRVTVKNTGDATANGVRLSIRGRGVSVKVPEGTIAPGRSRTVKVKVRFRKPGRIKATVKATAKNAAATQAVKQIRVVR